ncbi:MAG: hypothetical protein MUC47_07690 [Candidatus Kapabacteria bacterium]|nr:hypothetical protein [Candidatus Kapabacteria bacterium]
MIRFLLVTTLLVTTSRIALATDAQELLRNVTNKLQGVQTYVADVRIKVDIAFLKAPESKATIYFKAPNRTAIDAPGFAMIPKQGADLSAANILRRPHQAIDGGTAPFQGKTLRRVKVLPTEENADIVVATLWIDEEQLIVRKVETTTKQGGTVVAELVYDNAQARSFGLPSYAKLMLDIGSFELPKTMTGDFDAPSKQSNGKSQKAIVEVWYSSYTFNKPIPEEKFK